MKKTVSGTQEKIFGVYRNSVRALAAAVLLALLLGAATGVVRRGGAERILRRVLFGKEACPEQVPRVQEEIKPGSVSGAEEGAEDSEAGNEKGRLETTDAAADTPEQEIYMRFSGGLFP